MRINSTSPLVDGLKNRKYKRVFITTHHKPDGDAMGSTLGLMKGLKAFVEEVYVVTPTDYPESLHWLPGNEHVINFEENPEIALEKLHQSDLVCCLDFNVLSRINALGSYIASHSAEILLIDHHQNPDTFYQYALWDNESSSTCELVFEFFRDHFGDEYIDKDMVACLYTGLMTDTGNFQYVNTRAKTHQIAAEMMEFGVDHVGIYDRMFHVFSINRSRLFGYCLYKKLEIIEECKTALIYLSREELQEFSVITGDTEGLVNFGLGIKGVVLSVLIIDRTERVKMSFRSKGNFKVNEFAAKYFSGGGHYNAAGGQSEEPLEVVVSNFKKYLQEYKSELNLIAV